MTSQARGEWVQDSGDTLRVGSGNSDTHYEPTNRYLRDHHGPRAARLATHVEIKIAAAMRRDGLTDETVVMDRTVCGTRDNGRTKPLTCDKYLPRVLPPGGRL
ncbi:SCP1.201-like deaminase [Prauserella halophila]|nr:SCP1.201-like deaminase [Prauserella halophila]